MTLLQDGANSNFSMWKFAQASVQGRGHVNNNVPCQDKTFTISQNNVCSIVLADGAGSASLSHIGAEGTTKTVGAYLCENFDRLYEQNDANIARELLMESIKTELTNLSLINQCEIKDLASTLLAVAVKDEHYIILHIGDGVIGLYDGESIKVASMPENGEFANSTFFTTSNNAKNHLRLFKGRLKNIVGFIMFSDGPEPILCHHKEKEITPSLTQAFDDIKTIERAEVEYNLLATLNLIKNRVTDDCSIVMMSKSEDILTETLVELGSPGLSNLDTDAMSINSENEENGSSVADDELIEKDVNQISDKSDVENSLHSWHKTPDLAKNDKDSQQRQSLDIEKNPLNGYKAGIEDKAERTEYTSIEDECQGENRHPECSEKLINNAISTNHYNENLLKTIICILFLVVVVLTLLLIYN